MNKKILFLDRDGVINYDYGYIANINKFTLYLDSIVLIKKAIKNNYLVHIVTNQSGIARKYFSVEDFYQIMDYLERNLSNHGISNISYSFCPHRPEENCSCRKPAKGIVSEFLKKNSIDSKNSIMVGDKFSDIQFGKNLNLRKLFRIERKKSISLEKCNKLKISYYSVNSLSKIVEYL